MAGSSKREHGVCRGRAGWSVVVAAWRESGLSAREFCRRHGLVQSTFQWWRWRLSSEEGQPVEGAAVPALLRVRVVGTAAEGGSASTGAASAVLELVLPSGVQLRVPAGFDERTVAGVLWALEAVGPC